MPAQEPPRQEGAPGPSRPENRGSPRPEAGDGCEAREGGDHCCGECPAPSMRTRWREKSRPAANLCVDLRPQVLYTGPMYQIYNAVLRQYPRGVFEWFAGRGNSFATTIHILVSAVVKIARVNVRSKSAPFSSCPITTDLTFFAGDEATSRIGAVPGAWRDDGASGFVLPGVKHRCFSLSRSASVVFEL